MRRQWRHSAILRVKIFIVHNGGYEEYVHVDAMSAMEIYTEIKSMSCDALNLLLLDFSGTMPS